MSCVDRKVELKYREAGLEDVPAIVSLVNSAYRGDSSRLGWTTEADLLDGQRTDAGLVSTLITDPGSLILLCIQDDVLVGCVHLSGDAGAVSLGMFTIRPDRQGQGLGKVFLAAVEAAAAERFGTGRISMLVISRRLSLIAFYERRGYRRTGQQQAFPDDVRYGIPKVAELVLEQLVKSLPERA